MEGDATTERRYLRSPVSALKYLQRPSDPLKDGSIFQMGPRLSPNGAGLPLTNARQGASLGISQSLGPSPYTPSHGFTATPGIQLRTPDRGQLSSRVDIARHIRANFDNLVRESPLPRAVERLVTPSAGRLAALAPPQPWWRQGSPIYPLEDANTTPQHLLQIKPQLQPGFLSPALRSIPTDAPQTAPVSKTPSGHAAGTQIHPLSAIIRPIPLAPSFGPSADALYTPRPTGRGRDPRLIRSLAQVAPASAPGVTQAQPEPAIPEASREPIAEATKHISTEAQDQQETFQREVPEASASEAPQPDSGRTVTDAAAARARAEEQRRQQDQHPSQQSRRSPRTSFLATREAEPAVSSPQHHQSDVRAGHVHLEASGAADPQAHSPARSGVRGQAHVTVPERDHATSTAQRLPCSQASKVPRVACQSSQPELLCMEQLKPDSLSGAAHGSSCDNQQGVKPWDDQPSAPTGNSRGAQLPAQAADASLKSRPVETRAPAAQSGGCTSRQKPQSKGTERREAGTIVAQVQIQVSRTRRVRAPPLAFWANERISRNADLAGGSAIERGFSDQLAQQCESFVQSPSGKKPKKVADTAEPGRGKGSKAMQTQWRSADVMERRKGVKRKHLEAKERLAASSQSADAVTTSARPPTPGSSSPAQHGEELAAERSILEKPDGRKPRSYQCEVCQKRHRGHCGTEKAVKACLRRKLVQTAQPGVPAAPAQAASGAERHSAAQPKGQVLGRTLGIAAQLQALSRRPNDAGEAAQALVAAQAGQELGLPRQPNLPAKANSKASLLAHQPGQKPTQERASKKQRAAGKQGSLSVKGSEETLTDKSAAAERVRPCAAGPAKASEPMNTSEHKRATHGKRASGQKARALDDTQEFSRGASASHTASDAPKRKASAHDSISSAPQQGGSSRSKLGKGSGPSQKAPSSKLRKLTKAGNTAIAKQEVQVVVDLGANASSGTSNEEDDVQADDGGDWSDGQAAALQRAYLVAEDPTVPNFWHNVAQHVPGKTAQDCHNRLWAANPTPKGSKGGNPRANLLAAEGDSDNSLLMPPPRKNAAGGSKRPAPGATRKWAREVRWHERASQAASAAGAMQQPDPARTAARSSANPTLLAAMQQQQRTDRYIDALIRKRGPLHKWAKGVTAKRFAPVVAPMSLSHPELQGAVAAIASATQGAKDAEADEEASDHDQYWSDDC